MDKLFLAIVNMSLTGAFVIAAICLARQLLKKAPKIMSYALWAVAGFRLIFPFSIESVFSLIPFAAAPIPADIAMQPIPHINSGVMLVDNIVSGSLPAPMLGASANPLQIWMAIGAFVWLTGVAIMLIYGVISFVALKGKMKEAAHCEANIYETTQIKSPFVLGVFSPKIYLPAALSEHERGYILLHEQTHIRRRDHIVKFAAYFVLCLHWFNPLAWLAFLLMSADMEMACDERVMRELGGDIRDDYSMSLVRIAAGRRIPCGSPLAFGEGGMKERVKRVLNFRKPSRIIIAVAVILTVALSVGFALNRASENVNAASGEIYVFPEENFASVFFQCNDSPYNPEYIVISAQLMNNQNVRGLACGESFTLVEKAGDSWRTVPFAEGTGFDDIAFMLEDGSSFGYDIRPEMLAVKLHEGQYRIVTHVWITGEKSPASTTGALTENDSPASQNMEKHLVWADFSIDKNAPPQETFTVPASWFGNASGKEMTLNDVRELAAKGDGLLFEDLQQYQGGNASSDFNYNIMVYSVAGGYRLVVHSKSHSKPDRVNLESVWEDGGSGIDIRYNDVDEFLQTNPSQKPITADEALGIAQVILGVELESVSWHILADWPGRADYDAAFAQALLDSTYAISEPCWVLRVKGTAEWGGRYYAVGKKSSALYIYHDDAWSVFIGETVEFDANATPLNYMGNLGDGTLAWPYRGDGISSGFGVRANGYHIGIDIKGSVGDILVAADDGVVTLAEWYEDYGNLIIIEHADGMETWYGHLSAYAVSKGDTVTRGQIIGAVGSTGQSTGPHLHFEVRVDGQTVDPLLYLGFVE